MGQKAKSAGKKKVTQGGVGGAMVADKPVVSEGLQSKVDLSSAIEPLTHAVSHVEENTAGNRVCLFSHPIITILVIKLFSRIPSSSIAILMAALLTLNL